MVEDKKVLLVKVDSLKNTADALTKSASSKKLSWCGEIMGITEVDQGLISLVAPYGKKQQVG